VKRTTIYLRDFASVSDGFQVPTKRGAPEMGNRGCADRSILKKTANALQRWTW